MQAAYHCSETGVRSYHPKDTRFRFTFHVLWQLLLRCQAKPTNSALSIAPKPFTSCSIDGVSHHPFARLISCRDNGKEHGNYYRILGLYRNKGEENGNCYSMLGLYGIMEKKMESVQRQDSGK